MKLNVRAPNFQPDCCLSLCSYVGKAPLQPTVRSASVIMNVHGFPLPTSPANPPEVGEFTMQKPPTTTCAFCMAPLAQRASETENYDLHVGLQSQVQPKTLTKNH